MDTFLAYPLECWSHQCWICWLRYSTCFRHQHMVGVGGDPREYHVLIFTFHNDCWGLQTTGPPNQLVEPAAFEPCWDWWMAIKHIESRWIWKISCLFLRYEIVNCWFGLVVWNPSELLEYTPTQGWHSRAETRAPPVWLGPWVPAIRVGYSSPEIWYWRYWTFDVFDPILYTYIYIYVYINVYYVYIIYYILYYIILCYIILYHIILHYNTL
jgi:hypothetical protein